MCYTGNRTVRSERNDCLVFQLLYSCWTIFSQISKLQERDMPSSSPLVFPQFRDIETIVYQGTNKWNMRYVRLGINPLYLRFFGLISFSRLR